MNNALAVLIVEDSDADAQLLLRELHKGGFEPTFQRVETAGGMEQALDRQSWDIILSDYVMPHFSGLAALALAKKKGSDIPFIVISGKIGEDVAVEAMRAGANDYILKGNLARLVPAIERELQDAIVRRERRQAQEERDRLLVQLREVNEQLVLTSIKAKEQSAELDAVISSMAAALIVNGLSGEIIHMNPYAEDLLAFSPAERVQPLAQRLLALQIETEDGKPIPPEEIPGARALRGETVHGLVSSMIRPADRKRIWLSVSAAPIHGAQGKISGAVVILTDISALHTPEMA